jgi:hypothetical protein
MTTMIEPGWPHGNRPPHTPLWELWKTGRFMSCEINDHPLGWEIRCYLRGDLHCSQASWTRELAEGEAEAKKQELLVLGWTDRPPMPA